MILLVVDAGNTRVKWGLHDGHSWLAQGAVAHADIAALAEEWMPLPQPELIVVSNVAGAAMRIALQPLLARWAVRPYWVTAQAQQCGVSCGYIDPSQLGADRWAALIAARNITSDACLVVNVGTAVTIDALSHMGEFLGGLILPGLDLMRSALDSGTAGVHVARGQFASFPTNTADAVYSGAVQGVVGAIERMSHELQRVSAGKSVLLLSGGGASELLPHLNSGYRLIDNLVLEGLLIIAREGATG